MFATYLRNASGIDQSRCAAIPLDVTDAQATVNLFRDLKPQVVFHAAGHASVDFCQRHPDDAHKSNVLGTANVISACKTIGARLIYISTNAVFDGRSAPYAENAEPNPINVYGKLKLECEQLVAQSEMDYAIVRLIFMYGWQPPGARTNPLAWIVENLRQGKQLHLVNDVFENPLWSDSGADGLWAVAHHGTSGIYHLAGRDVVNRFDLAIVIARTFGLDEQLIQPVESDFFPDIAPRPRNTSFVTLRAQRELGWQPVGLADGLTQARAEQPTGVL